MLLFNCRKRRSNLKVFRHVYELSFFSSNVLFDVSSWRICHRSLLRSENFCSEISSQIFVLEIYLFRDGKVCLVIIFLIWLLQSESAQCCFQTTTSLLEDVWWTTPLKRNASRTWMTVSFCATWATAVSVLTSKRILTIINQVTSVS